MNTLPRTLGVEVEIGEWKKLRAGKTIPYISYNTTHDWSVQPSGQEMVVAPLRKDAFVRGMLSLSKELFLSECVLNETCAMHVHVGAEDLSCFEIRRLLEVYRRCEDEIYSHLIAPHRWKKPEAIHYCQRMNQPHRGVCARCERYDSQYPGQRVAPEGVEIVLARMWKATTTKDLKLCLLRMLYGIENPSIDPLDLEHRKSGKYEFARYFGLNLHSWMHRMTVEWRMKEATADPVEMVCWPLWCGWMTHLVTRLTDTEARSDRMGVRYLTERYMPRFLHRWVKEKGL